MKMENPTFVKQAYTRDLINKEYWSNTNKHSENLNAKRIENLK